MKKILIFSHGLKIGGAERALLGLLENIDKTKYSVDLFLMNHTGEMMDYIPDNINLLPEISQYTCLAVPILEVLRKHHFKLAYLRWKGKKAAVKRNKELNLYHSDVAIEYSHKYTLKAMPQISNVEYDTVISFLTPHYFAANRVNAKKRIAWIHLQSRSISRKKCWIG